MKVLRFFPLISLLILSAGFAAADSLELRNGKHIQGKYIGGTTTEIGFMTSGTVEYFSTADVLVLVFDNSTENPLSDAHPSPMRKMQPKAPTQEFRSTKSQPFWQLQPKLKKVKAIPAPIEE